MDLKVKIRKFRKGDQYAVARIIREATRVTNKGFYSPAIIKHLCLDARADKILAKAKIKNFRVTILKDKIVGVVGLTENRIRQFFVHPTYQGKGIGRLLIEYIQTEAKKLNMNFLDVHSSLYAVEFYKHFGFKKVKVFKPNKLNNRLFTVVVMKKVLI
jgi:N-acetylglutamate synthase-like GNAT family acetyltransferase